MSRAEEEIRQALFGKQDYRPLVKFYDHAVPDAAATEASGRPRFRQQLNVLIKPTHPDLTVRDTVSRKAEEKHMAEFREEYEAYLKNKERTETEFRTPLQGVPGMTVVAFRELTELGIEDTLDLAEYEGDLGEIDYLREAAKKIMEVARAVRASFEESERIRKERETIRPVPSRSQYSGGAGITQTEEKESDPENVFSYSFKVSY